LETVVVSGSEEETVSLGRKIGAHLVAGDVVAVTGELGAGKSVIARGICEGLGIRQRTRSPSFAFVYHYRGPVDVYHVDLYRVEGANDLSSLGLEDILSGDNVTIVEWAEKLGPALGPGCLEIFIEVTGEETRKITIKDGGAGRTRFLDETGSARSPASRNTPSKRGQNDNSD